MVDITFESAGHGENKLKDLEVGKRILDVLEKYYPLHPWFASCCHEAGVATVQLMYDGQDGKTHIWKYGYVLHLSRLIVDDFEHKVMEAGGEVLERYHMAREQVSMNSFIDFKEKGIDKHCMVN